MSFLITTSRMPCAIDEIRKLGRMGHHVIATDTFPTAPGSHSKYASQTYLTHSPRHESSRFVSEIARIVASEHVVKIVPQFEEVFYLAKEAHRFPEAARFFPSFELLTMLHDKLAFTRFATNLGIRAPSGTLVRSRGELEAAIACRSRYFAKPIYTRGGEALMTNSGKLAGASRADELRPSSSHPVVVQDFIEGEDVCTFSVVQHGRVTAHATYVHPREIEHSGGIVFESIDSPECVEIAQRIAAATQYHGQMSLDLIQTKGELVAIECNTRPTAGVHLMSDEMFVNALLDEDADELRVVPAGVRRKYVAALLRDMVVHFKEAREDARHLLSDAKEVVADPDDLMPAIYQVLSYSRVIAYRKQLHLRGSRPIDLKAAYFEDICWNGEEAGEESLPAAEPSVSAGA